MGWEKLVDNYSGSAFTTDRVFVGGRESIPVIYDGTLSSLELQVHAAMNVDDGAGGKEEQTAQVAIVNPANGDPVPLALDVSGGFTVEVPCLGDWLFFDAVGGGTWLSGNLWVYL